MDSPTRRAFLSMSAIGVSTILAGCVDEIQDINPDSTEDDAFEEYTEVDGQLRFSNASLEIDSQATFGLDFPDNIVETDESPIILEFELTNNREESIFVSDVRDTFFTYTTDTTNSYILLPEDQIDSMAELSDSCWLNTEVPVQTTEIQTESISEDGTITQRMAIVQYAPAQSFCSEPPESITFNTSFYIHSERGIQQGEFVTAELTLQQ